MSTYKLTRRQMLQTMGIAASGAALAACVPAGARAGDEPTDGETEPPDIWVATSTPCPGGGNPERTAAVRDHLLELTGVRVNAYLSASGHGARTEKLNLLIASGTEPLDVFEGAWPDFKGIVHAARRPARSRVDRTFVAGHSDLDWKMMKDFEGTTWGYPRLGLMGHTHFPFFRSDWLAEAGLDVPDTWDGMEDAYLAMRDNNPGGDHHHDGPPAPDVQHVGRVHRSWLFPLDRSRRQHAQAARTPGRLSGLARQA